MLTASAQQRLDGELASFSSRTGNQIAVAVVPTLQGESVETYAYQLFNAWGVGQRGRNNGVLVLVSTGDRQLRVEVGSGLTQQISDSKAQSVVAAMTPDLHSGDFVDDLLIGERDIRRDLGDNDIAASTNDATAGLGGGQTSEVSDASSGSDIWWGVGALTVIVAGAALAWRSMRGWTKAPDAVPIGRRGWWGGGYNGRFTGGGGASSGAGFGGGSTGGGGASGGF